MAIWHNGSEWVYGIRKPDFNSVSNTYKLCDLTKDLTKDLPVPQFPHQQMKTIIVPTLKKCYGTQFILNYSSYCYVYCQPV